MGTVIVYGGQRCGKTTLAKLLASVYGCPSVVDDWGYNRRDVVPGALHLYTCTSPTMGDRNYARKQGAVMIPFDVAIRRLFPAAFRDAFSAGVVFASELAGDGLAVTDARVVIGANNFVSGVQDAE